MTDDDARRRADTFVREVEAALGDLPTHRRTELTEGLADHLLEPHDDGKRLIDEPPDPQAYADELRALAPTATAPPARGRHRVILVGAGLLAVAIGVGTWLGTAGFRDGDATTPEPTAAPTATAEPDLVVVPNVLGLPEQEAKLALEQAGLAVESWYFLGDTGDAPDTVVLVEPEAGTHVVAGLTVIIHVLTT